MPSFLDYVKNEGKLPTHLSFSIAALMAFYTGTEIRDKALIGHRNGEEYQILDDEAVLKFFAENSSKEAQEFTEAVLSNTAFWGQDLSKIEGLKELVTEYITSIREIGMRKTMEKYFA
jgi:tagaturonate reductase